MAITPVGTQYSYDEVKEYAAAATVNERTRVLQLIAEMDAKWEKETLKWGELAEDQGVGSYAHHRCCIGQGCLAALDELRAKVEGE